MVEPPVLFVYWENLLGDLLDRTARFPKAVRLYKMAAEHGNRFAYECLGYCYYYGRGMEPELLYRVTDPFTTTRTTRRVGLGIPMLMQSAQFCGGSFTIDSELDRGTVVEAVFQLDHIDCPPMGAMCDTLFALVMLNPTDTVMANSRSISFFIRRAMSS